MSTEKISFGLILELRVFETVTRLGEFSHIGRLFALGSVLKITEVAQIFSLLFSMVRGVYVSISTNNWLGYILGDFFTNSSGHSAKTDPCSTNFRIVSNFKEIAV
jgi:hypothetical protein